MSRAEAARKLFTDLPQVRVLHDDWSALLHTARSISCSSMGQQRSEATVDVDGPAPETDVLAPLLAAVRIGGLIVLDDLTPESAWPPEWHGHPDPTRSLWLNDSRLAATELIIDPAAGPHSVVIVASRAG